MAVRIRLRRTGKRNAPAHRIVVTDSRSPRDGRFIEVIGFYDPRGGMERIDIERADYWVSNGAQPSETVGGIIQRAKAGVSLADRKGSAKEQAEAARQAAAEKAVAEKKAKAEAEAAAAAAEAEAAAAAAAETEAEEGAEEAPAEPAEEAAKDAE